MRLAAQPDAAGRRDLLLRRRRRRRSGRNSSGNATIAADVLPEFLREYSSAAPSLHVLRHEASRVGNGINTSSDGDVKKILYLDDEMIYPPLLVESLSRAADRRPDSAVAFSGARAARSLPPDQAHRPRSSTCTQPVLLRGRERLDRIVLSGKRRGGQCLSCPPTDRSKSASDRRTRSRRRACTRTPRSRPRTSRTASASKKTGPSTTSRPSFGRRRACCTARPRGGGAGGVPTACRGRTRRGCWTGR